MSTISFLWNENALHILMQNASLLILLICFALSLVLLVKGSDWLIDSVVNIALKKGISKGILGATVVSLGTTLPEVVVSVSAAVSGKSSLALGNGLGSIIADTALILGLIFCLAKIPINRSLFKELGRWHISSLLLLTFLLIISKLLFPDVPRLQPWAGIILLIALGCYLVHSLKQNKNQIETNIHEPKHSFGYEVMFLCIGLLFIFTGSRWLIASIIEIAIRLGISEATIAVTVVAFGTSLPELITAITAVRKKHPDIMIGNILGADILNAFFVVGASSTISSLKIDKDVLMIHLPTALFAFFILYFRIRNPQKKYFSRWQGIVLLGTYLLFLFIFYLKVKYRYN